MDERKSQAMVNRADMLEALDEISATGPKTGGQTVSLRSFVYENYDRLRKLVEEEGFTVPELYETLKAKIGFDVTVKTFSTYYYGAKKEHAVNLKKRPRKKTEPKAEAKAVETRAVEPKAVEQPEPVKPAEKTGSERLADFKSDTERRDSEFEKLAAQIAKNTGE